MSPAPAMLSRKSVIPRHAHGWWMLAVHDRHGQPFVCVPGTECKSAEEAQRRLDAGEYEIPDYMRGVIGEQVTAAGGAR
jgi:hypothetical protein